jgi:ribosomal protein S18 acetylase RimI-like enzyme
VEYQLEPFNVEHAEVILGWVQAAEDRDAWASRAHLELTPELFCEWHADPDVHAYVLTVDGVLCGYGEVWTDEAEAEAELARVVVPPRSRGRGVGRRLVTLLAERASELGFADVWVRVLPTNVAALAAYAAAGFSRASADEEERFNAGQPRKYVWMRLMSPRSQSSAAVPEPGARSSPARRSPRRRRRR